MFEYLIRICKHHLETYPLELDYAWVVAVSRKRARGKVGPTQQTLVPRLILNQTKEKHLPAAVTDV